MAAYTISSSARAVHGVALVADVEDTVTFTGRIDGEVTVLVHPGGTTPVYVTTDGTPATVPTPGEGANTRVVWPGYAAQLTDQRQGTLTGLDGSTDTAPTVVRLISEGAATYSVEA